MDLAEWALVQKNKSSNLQMQSWNQFGFSFAIALNCQKWINNLCDHSFNVIVYMPLYKHSHQNRCIHQMIFTPMKDYSPKCQFLLKKIFHYGV